MASRPWGIPDDATVRAALVRPEHRLIPVEHKNIGAAFAAVTRARFRTSPDPGGNPWAPLNPLYAKSKRGPSILLKRSGLMSSIVYQVSGNPGTALSRHRYRRCG